MNKLDYEHVMEKLLKFVKLYKFDDVILETKDETGQIIDLTVDSLRLYKSSPVLGELMIKQLKKTQTNRIKVYDYSTSIIKALLAELGFKSVRNKTPERNAEVMEAAEKYEMDWVVYQCLRSVFRAATVKNILQSFTIIINIASRPFDRPYTRPHLPLYYQYMIRMCLNIILANFKEICQTQEWEDFPKKLLFQKGKLSLKRNLYDLSLISIIRNFEVISESQAWKELPKYYVDRLIYGALEFQALHLDITF